MEVLAATASIAGLLSLAGQCISGAQELKTFYQDLCKASTTIRFFLKDVNNLLNTLHDVQDLLQRVKEQAELDLDTVHTASLQIQLEDCNVNVVAWLVTARSMRDCNGKSSRALFRKLWVTVNKDSVDNIRDEMRCRRVEISVALSILGRYIYQLGVIIIR